MATKTRTRSLPVLGGYDYRRLKLLDSALKESASRDRSMLESLRSKLDRAVVVNPREVPADVVTLYSKVRFRNIATDVVRTRTIVFPGEIRDREDCVSVLAPVGIALLGERVGETVTCVTPEGPAVLRILDLEFQPEASGEYDL